MMSRILLSLGVVLGLAVAAALAKPDPDAVLGLWWTDGNQAKIEIYKDGGKYFGKLAWFKEPKYPEGDPEAGQPKRDRKNPDVARQHDPLLGLNILKGFEFDGSSTWQNGKIYDPQEGKTYTARMKLRDQDTLDVRGYVGIPLFGRSTVWKRVVEEKKEAAPATR